MKRAALALLVLSVVPGIALWSCASEETADGTFSGAGASGDNGGAGPTTGSVSTTSGGGMSTTSTTGASSSSASSTAASTTASSVAASSSASGGANCTMDFDCFLSCMSFGMCVNGMCQCTGLDGGFLPDGFDFDGGFPLDGFSIPDGFDFDGGLPDF